MKLFFQIVGLPVRLLAAVLLLIFAGLLLGFFAIFEPSLAEDLSLTALWRWVLYGEPMFTDDHDGYNGGF